MRLLLNKYSKATAAVAVTSSLVLNGCASIEGAKDESQTNSVLSFANEYGQREVTSFNIGKITVNILTDGQQGDDMPSVDEQAFKDAVGRLVEEPLKNLDELIAEIPGLTQQDKARLKENIPAIQAEFNDTFNTVINGHTDKVWTVVLPSERDTCVGDGMYANLPSESEECSKISSLGLTMITANNNDGELTVNSNEVATIIAPNTIDDKIILKPAGKDIEMNAAQAVESTIGHEAVHAFLGFNGVNDYMNSEGVEEILIQILELNAAKTISNEPYAVTWE